MKIKFDPNNPIIKLCMTGMGLEEGGNSDEALAMFQKAWEETRDDYERFIASYHWDVFKRVL